MLKNFNRNFQNRYLSFYKHKVIYLMCILECLAVAYYCFYKIKSQEIVYYRIKMFVY